MFTYADIKTQANLLKPWLIELRRTIHKQPELGLEEYKTAAFIEAKLTELNIDYERIDTAITATIHGREGGKTVALRADIDALPIQEAHTHEYASQCSGLMHACGHDAHTAILLGTAKLFSTWRNDFSGNIKLLFQPAEETVGGAETMIQNGCLENPHVDYVLGLHVMPYLPVGRIETKKAALNGSSTDLQITIQGQSCHAAYPEKGVDAIMVAAHIVTALHTLVSRYVSPLDSAVLSIGTIEGGTRSNIIAEKVTMKATLRTTSDETRDIMLQQIKSVVENGSKAFGAEGQVQFKYGYAALINNAEVVDLIALVADGLLGKNALEWKEKPSMGVEDFSFFCKERQGAFYHIGCGNVEKSITAALHTPQFDIDEDCMPVGLAMQAALSLTLLGYKL